MIIIIIIIAMTVFERVTLTRNRKRAHVVNTKEICNGVQITSVSLKR